MSSDPDPGRFRQVILDRAADYQLHNTVHIIRRTCKVCKGALLYGKYWTCDKCRNLYGRGAADLVGSMIYGCSGLPSGNLMYRYKDPQPTRESVLLVKALTAVGLRHRNCADALVTIPSTHWAAVPSLRKIGSPHPFREILTTLQSRQPEIKVAASESARGISDEQRRQLNPDNYVVLTTIPRGSHVTVVDDTWVSGAHAQSVAMALKQAGAATVSILAIARWLDLHNQRTKWTYNDRIRDRPYNPDICPWTGGDCPPRRASVAERRPTRPPMRCSLHNIELSATGECDECSKLIKRPKKPVEPRKPVEQRKPWWQFW